MLLLKGFHFKTYDNIIFNHYPKPIEAALLSFEKKIEIA